MRAKPKYDKDRRDMWVAKYAIKEVKNGAILQCAGEDYYIPDLK